MEIRRTWNDKSIINKFVIDKIVNEAYEKEINSRVKLKLRELEGSSKKTALENRSKVKSRMNIILNYFIDMFKEHYDFHFIKTKPAEVIEKRKRFTAFNGLDETQIINIGKEVNKILDDSIDTNMRRKDGSKIFTWDNVKHLYPFLDTFNGSDKLTPLPDNPQLPDAKK